MPKQRITKEMVVEAAFELTREGGEGNATVKNVAKRLGCSVQPIYSYCESMEGLRQAVALRANDFVRRYVAARLNGDDLFRATGLAHLALAREEPHIFRLFITSDRNGVASLDDLYRTSSNPQMAQHIAQCGGISEAEARALHLHMLIYTVGVGAIAATALPGIPEEELIAQLEGALQAFANQLSAEREKDTHGKQGDDHL